MNDFDETPRSITQWIGDLKAGDESAAQAIWERFFHRVQGLARKKLAHSRKRFQDEDDVALSAINALCQGAKDGRFRQLENRDDLWQVLVMVTSRKASNVRRKERSTHEHGESVMGVGAGEQAAGIDQLVAGKPTEQFIESMTGVCEELLGGLEEKLQTVALLKLQGYTNEEIAVQQNRSVKTIERYLKMIRQKWRIGD